MEQIMNTPYLTKQGLSLLLKKDGENLNYWVNKMLREGSLTALKKGLYISKYYKYAKSEGYLEYLANLLRYPSYVSLEYVLSMRGLIPESVFSITSVTLKSTRSYKSLLSNFIYKNIKEELFFGYKQRIFEGKNVRVATTAKALFDFLYLKKFGTKEEMITFLLEYGRINWGVLEKRDKREFASIVKKSKSVKMDFILKVLQKEKLL